MKARVVSITAQDLAKALNAQLHGDGQLVVTGLCPLHTPCAGHLTFFKGRSPTAAFNALVKLPQVAVLIEPALLPDAVARRSLQCTVLFVPDAQRAFVDAVALFFEPEVTTSGIHPTAIIDPSALIAPGVAIGPHCCIGAGAQIKPGAILYNSVTIYRDVTIGARTQIHSGAVVREGCSVGNDCIIHNNAVIGADGFGYLPDPVVGVKKVPQVGVVTIADHVEIGACTSIDRATVGATTIGAYTKIDNHVQIGHNVSIGSHCLICAQAGIAGSATIEDAVVLGGGTGVADHVRIASRVRVGGHAGVTSDLVEAGDYLGMPAIRAGLYRRQQARLKRLAQDKRGVGDDQEQG